MRFLFLNETKRNENNNDTHVLAFIVLKMFYTRSDLNETDDIDEIRDC